MLQPGDTFGRFVIVETIGAGGMGIVYAARHSVLGKDVALKVLAPNLAYDDRVRERFVREAQIQANLKHPGIVSVEDIIEDHGLVGLVMGLVRGPSLQAVLDEEPRDRWTLPAVLGVLDAIVDALAAAHGAGVIHRDIKPGNVLLDRTANAPWPGRPCLTDFGLAKILGSDNFTRTGARMGTEIYMAPEQYRGASGVDARADVYAVGMMAWRLLAGRLPVDPNRPGEIVELYAGTRPIPPIETVAAETPPHVSRWVHAALATNPDERPADARALLALMRGQTPTSHTPAPPTPHTRAGASSPPGGPITPAPASAPPAPSYPPQPPSYPADSTSTPGSSQPSTYPPPPAHAAPAGRRTLLWVVPLAVIVGSGLVAAAILLRPRQSAPTASPSSTQAANAERPQRPAPEPVSDLLQHCPNGFVRIRSGAFPIGSPYDEPGRDPDEGPRHRVRIPWDFCMERTEVTHAEWLHTLARTPFSLSKFLPRKPWYFSSCGANCPVEHITWFEALAYADARSVVEGLSPCYSLSGCYRDPDAGLLCERVEFAGIRCNGYRLPLEAEWEYAARAGTTTTLPTRTGRLTILGRNNGPELHPIAWYGGNSAASYPGAWKCGRWKEKQFEATLCGPHPVGLKEPNPWGLYDMLGNVFEWTWDRYTTQYDVASEPEITTRYSSPWGEQVLRGGAWNTSARYVRPANRAHDPPQHRGHDLGLRLVITVAR